MADKQWYLRLDREQVSTYMRGRLHDTGMLATILATDAAECFAAADTGGDPPQVFLALARAIVAGDLASQGSGQGERYAWPVRRLGDFLLSDAALCGGVALTVFTTQEPDAHVLGVDAAALLRHGNILLSPFDSYVQYDLSGAQHPPMDQVLRYMRARLHNAGFLAWELAEDAATHFDAEEDGSGNPPDDFVAVAREIIQAAGRGRGELARETARHAGEVTVTDSATGQNVLLAVFHTAEGALFALDVLSLLHSQGSVLSPFDPQSLLDLPVSGRLEDSSGAARQKRSTT